jgi:hypothetical protein
MPKNKIGFSYYNVDTDRYQDIRIKRLKKSFGCMGIAVYDYVLCEIYRVRGCFIEWDESTAFDVAEYFDLKESQVNEIINYCCAVGLFNKELLVSGSILTSASIQKRFIEMSTRAKRKDIVIPDICKIREELPKIPEESAKLPEKTSKLPEVCDKVKKSKVVTESTNVDSASDGKPPDNAKKKGSDFEINDFERLITWFNDQTKGVFGNVKYPISDKRKSMVRARIREHGKETFMAVVKMACESNFLRGQNKSNFTATFDWIIKPSNFEKILSGNYSNKRANEQEQTPYIVD